jgi:hypothetical protein
MKTERDSNASIQVKTMVKTSFTGSPFAKEYFTFVPCPLKKLTKGC